MALHVLRHVYTEVPTLKVVVQDHPGPIERATQYWAQELPDAIRDCRVEFEVHDFFNENPRREPNTIYWFRFVMRESSYALHNQDYTLRYRYGYR